MQRKIPESSERKSVFTADVSPLLQHGFGFSLHSCTNKHFYCSAPPPQAQVSLLHLGCTAQIHTPGFSSSSSSSSLVKSTSSTGFPPVQQSNRLHADEVR